MTDIKELKDEELKKVSGGGYYDNDPDKWFNTNAIVEDSSGIRYKILGLNCTETSNGKKYNWFDALVTFVPESVKTFTFCREGDVHQVNSSFVKLVG